MDRVCNGNSVNRLMDVMMVRVVVSSLTACFSSASYWNCAFLYEVSMLSVLAANIYAASVELDR